jgi:hypothetical protein
MRAWCWVSSPTARRVVTGVTPRREIGHDRQVVAERRHGIADARGVPARPRGGASPQTPRRRAGTPRGRGCAGARFSGRRRGGRRRRRWPRGCRGGEAGQPWVPPDAWERDGRPGPERRKESRWPVAVGYISTWSHTGMQTELGQHGSRTRTSPAPQGADGPQPGRSRRSPAGRTAGTSALSSTIARRMSGGSGRQASSISGRIAVLLPRRCPPVNGPRGPATAAAHRRQPLRLFRNPGETKPRPTTGWGRSPGLLPTPRRLHQLCG